MMKKFLSLWFLLPVLVLGQSRVSEYGNVSTLRSNDLTMISQPDLTTNKQMSAGQLLQFLGTNTSLGGKGGLISSNRLASSNYQSSASLASSNFVTQSSLTSSNFATQASLASSNFITQASLTSSNFSTQASLNSVSNSLNFTNSVTFWVDPNGSDSNPGTILKPFLTITNAIAHMSVSNKLNIMDGIYNIDTNKIIPPMGYVIDGHGSTIISDPDDGSPKLRVKDNCTAFNLTLKCSSNVLQSIGSGLFWGGVGNWNDNGVDGHLESPATNFYFHHIHLKNALSDGFYIGNTDYTNVYSGKVENCDGDGMFDMISVGGRTNSAITFVNCDFSTYQDPLNQTAAFFRTTGGTLNLIGVNYTVTNITASNPGQPFVLLNDGSTRVFIDGGRYTLFNKPGQQLTAQWYSGTINGGYMNGRFLFSTNGSGWNELAPGISNRWTTLPLPLLAFGAHRTNINASTSLFLSFQAIPSAGSGTMGFILNVVDAGVTNTYWTSAYADSVNGDIAALSFSHIPLNPNAIWWYDVDPNTTSTTLFGNITLDAIASAFSAYYLYNDGGASAAGVVINAGGTPVTAGISTNGGSGLNNTFTNTILVNATYPFKVIDAGVTNFAAGSRIVTSSKSYSTNLFFLTYQSGDGTSSTITRGEGAFFIPGVSFRVVSGNPTDTNHFHWMICKP